MVQITGRAYSLTAHSVRQRTLSMRKFTIPAVVAVMLAFGSWLVAGADRTIAADELARLIAHQSAPLIVDVRTATEYQSGHIETALNIPHLTLNNRLQELENHKHREIIVHCQRGPRAKAAKDILVRAGFTQITLLEGHMHDWLQQGLSVVTPK